MTLSPDSVPRIWRLARLDYDPARQRPVLLYPEGAVLLNDTGREILELVDGTRTVAEIAAAPRRALPDRRHRRCDRIPVASGGEGADPMTTERPTTLLAELTHRCPLHCPYCSNPLELLRAESEIGTDDWKRVFTQARELGVLQLGLSGGEPLIRKDLEELATHARSLGLYTTLVTSGLGLTRKRAEALRTAGLEHIQVSVQDADAETAERIAGVSSVKQKQAAIALVKELGFAFSINVVLHRANLDRIGEIIDLAAGWGADRLELANTQYYGWGLKNRATLMPTARAGPGGQGDRPGPDAALQGADADHLRAARLLRGAAQGVLRRMGTVLHRGVARRQGAAVPRRVRDPLARPAERAGPLDPLDLARVVRVPGVSRRRVDEGAVPQLPAEGGGLRRLPLPGVRAHRRRGQRRSGLHAEPAPPLIDEALHEHAGADAYVYRDFAVEPR